MQDDLLQPNRTAAGRSGLGLLATASAITIALSFVPMASIILYPIRLFVTFVHESSHAATALLTGGHVSEIVIQPDASGYTLTAGGLEPLIVMAGYLGAASFGAWLLWLGRRSGGAAPGRAARAGLGASFAISALATFLFVRPWHNPFGFGWGCVIAAGLFLAWRKLNGASAELLVMFLGVQCALNALSDLRTLIGLSTLPGGPPTDAALMAGITGIPSIVWALLWAILALAILWIGLRGYFGVKARGSSRQMIS